MKAEHIIAGAAAVGVLALGYKAWRQRQDAAAAAPAQAPGEMALAVGVAPPAQQAAQEAQGALPKLPKGLGTAAAVAVAGIKLQNAIGNVAEVVGGEGAGNVARIAPPVVGAATIIGKGVQAGLESVGVANEPSRVAGLVAGVAVVAGAPVAVAALTTQVAGSLLQEGLKAVAGEKVERAVSNAVSQLDPFKPDSLVNDKLVEPVANVVSWAGSLIGGKSEAEKQREALERAAAEQRAAEILAHNPAAGQQVASQAGGSIGALVQAVKGVAPPAPPSPAPAPPFVPPVVRAVLPIAAQPPPAPPLVRTNPSVVGAPPPTRGAGGKVKLGGLDIGL